ncbi:ADP-glyceromanno-heptose 6-epimerase [Pararoseomonas indoligenes]|uniref:ADP-L-glycero-D-manno-heptose-6-epimerase n=1 Tax=Roseomonas indoligenes TaxID=2820811 RepID=A0A940N301_9PROT|nr:ADP-glyceromanno-heptose 6-epimerase [Pararoseomonas indoligenes]MBP0495639.1 ADP-glyceromanno-heptose 6-epimerase [Pararoseomonas indoligenes]
MLLLTGAAGFIGSNLLARLNAEGRTDVVICDALGTEGKWRNLRAHEFADFVPIDALEAWLAHAPALDGVIHLGANSDTTAADGDEVMRHNFAASLTLWRHCAATGTPFLYASSAATYGNGDQGFEDRDDPAFLATLQPLNLYGWSKHVFDRRVARIVEAGEAAPPRWYGLKFFNVYGPNEYHKGHMRSAVHNITEAVRRGEPARLFASDRPDIRDGGQSRDFVWVDDICDVILWLLNGNPPSGLYNIGAGQARSFADLARAVFSALGKPPEIEFFPMPEALRGRYQYWTEANLGKLRRAGYNAPMTGLEDGVARYVQGFLTREDRYR